jgi:hypothetical protein
MSLHNEGRFLSPATISEWKHGDCDEIQSHLHNNDNDSETLSTSTVMWQSCCITKTVFL